MTRTPVRSPRASAFAGRLVGTLRRECLDHVLILGERHLREVLAGYARHCNGHRPRQGLQQESPQRQPGRVVDVTARIGHRRVVGGLISEYRRAALVGEKLLVSGYGRVLARDRLRWPTIAGPGICGELSCTGDDERDCNRRDWHRGGRDASPVLRHGHAAVGAVVGWVEGSAAAAGPDSHSASLMRRMR